MFSHKETPEEYNRRREALARKRCEARNGKPAEQPSAAASVAISIISALTTIAKAIDSALGGKKK